tara:strand:- start:109 stop:291 length:183 start_codon:yes stop_codon:yes gene_type:complete
MINKTNIRFQFYALCGKYLIDPSVALENDNVKSILFRNKSTNHELKQDLEDIDLILKEEF